MSWEWNEGQAGQKSLGADGAEQQWVAPSWMAPMTGEGQAEQQWVAPSWMAPTTGSSWLRVSPWSTFCNSGSLLPERKHTAFLTRCLLLSIWTLLCAMDVDSLPPCITTPCTSRSQLLRATRMRGIIHPLGHQSREGLTLSARTAFPRLKSGCWPGCLLFWGLTIKLHSIFSFTQLTDGLQFPALRTPCPRWLSAAHGSPQLLPHGAGNMLFCFFMVSRPRAYVSCNTFPSGKSCTLFFFF